jgi:predicted RND superfamily exporter protein
MSGLLTLPIRAPRSALAVILAVTAVLGLSARSISVDSAIENLLPSDDPERVYYEQVRAVFGSEQASLIGIFAPDVFAPATLAKIDRLSARLAALDGVREVISLTTMKGVETDEAGVHVGRLMRALPATPEEATAFRVKVLANPVYVGNVVAADGGATGVLVLFEPLSDAEFLQRRTERQIRALVAEYKGPEEFAVTGIQTFKLTGARLMRQDLAAFVPLAVALVVGVLVWACGTVRGVVLLLATVLISLVWTTGAMVLAGSAINMGTLVLPPLLLAIGIAYAIRMVSRYYQELEPGRPREAVVGAVVADVRIPVAVATLTTLLAFATLTFSPIPAVRDFGIYSMVGISSVFVVSLVFIPAVLVLLPEPRRLRQGRAQPHTERNRWVTALLERMSAAAIRRRRTVLLLTAGLCALSVWGATRIRVETDYLGFFGPRSRVRSDTDRIAGRLGGTQPVYVVVEGDGPRSVGRLETLAVLRDVQQFINQLPGVDSTLSLLDYLAVVRSALNPGAAGALPDTQAELDQLLLFMDPADVKPVAAPDLSRANIIVRTRLSRSAEVSDLVQRVEDYARSHVRRGVTVHPTGIVVLLNRSADVLARSQTTGLLHVLLVLLALLSLLFISVRAGLLALVPSIIPVFAVFGVMGWAGFSLNISTSMIAVIAIGITIDDTIHYLWAFNAQLQATGDREVAIVNAARSVGRPMVFTSIALLAGFLIVCLSHFQPIRDFGVLASVAMVAAPLADLLFMPALVMTTPVITLWDLLYVKLGPRPEKEIPLFADLRPFQARLVVLMAHLASGAPGTFITRRGEVKEELYVLLSGRVDVRRQAGEPVLRSLGRGEVIGEMGLVRRRPRSADAIVTEPAEYLVLDGGFLTRIRRHYPRIAATVLLNLTRILSDRLESTTDRLAGTPADAREVAPGPRP